MRSRGLPRPIVEEDIIDFGCYVLVLQLVMKTFGCSVMDFELQSYSIDFVIHLSALLLDIESKICLSGAF